MYQQHHRITAASLLLVFCFGCRLIAGAALEPLSISAKSSSTASLLPTFFNKPELDPTLTADTRLDRKVTLDEIGTPLGDLLQKVSAADMPLTCGPDCADMKLQMRLKDRSLRSVLAALAQLTPGTWKREGKGYCLYADPKATEYENHWWQLYGLERVRALATLRAEILAEMQQKPYIHKESDPNPENMPDEMFDRMAQGQEFWYLLPESLQKQVADQIVDTDYSGSTFVSRPIEGAVVASFRSISVQAQADALAGARLMLNGNKMGSPSTLSFNNIGLAVYPRILTTDGRWYDMQNFLNVHPQAIPPTLSLDHAGLPTLMKELGDQAPSTWKPLVEYQEQRVWPNDPFQVLTDPEITTNQPTPRRPEVLNWLADKAGVEFVADYYSVAGASLSDADKAKKLTRPLKRELDFQAAQEDMSWKQRTDGLYLFRDNRWYRDDRLEVPDRTLKELLKTLQAAETPSQAAPDAAASDASLAAQLGVADAITAQLTPWQIANGLPNYTIEPSRESVKASSAPVKLHKLMVTMNGKAQTFYFSPPTSTARPFDPIAGIVLDDYHTYLFHSGLSPEQAAALLADGLPVSALNDIQARQAAYLLPELQVAPQNQDQFQPPLLRLRSEPGFDQVQLGPTGSPNTALALVRVRLAAASDADAQNGDGASP